MSGRYSGSMPDKTLDMETGQGPSHLAGVPDALTTREPFLIHRQRVILRDLLELVAERSDAEDRIDKEFIARKEAAQRQFEFSFQDAVVTFASRKEAVEQELREARRQINARHQSEREAAEKNLTDTRAQITHEYETDKQAAKSEFQEARWTITAVYEGGKNGTERESEQTNQRLGDAAARVQSIGQEAKDYLEDCRLSAHALRNKDQSSIPLRAQDPFGQLNECLSQADSRLAQLKKLKIPQYFKGERLIWIFAIIWLLSIYPSHFLADWFYAFVGCTATTIALGVGLSAWLHSIAAVQAGRLYGPLCKALDRAETLIKECQEQAVVNYHRSLGEAKKRYNKEVRHAADKYQQLRVELKQRKTERLLKLAQEYRSTRTAIKERRAKDWKESSEKYRKERKEIQQHYDRDSQRANARLANIQAQFEAEHANRWQTLAATWRDGLAHFEAEAEDIKRQCSRLFPDWTYSSWHNWVPGDTVPPAILFGEYHVRLDQLPGGLPRHERLQVETATSFSLPALLPFPHSSSLLILAGDEGRAYAVEALQAIMFRLLTGIPPGKARFTIIDPVGLGQNFASFMHLADHDEALVTSRIWTEPQRIEQRLADLTEHMENVIQKYLRNQFETIDDYNEQAGEVAEPYRFLVVANFPVNFTTEAARRLASIISSGPRCGVHTLLTVDAKQPLPQGFDLTDFEQNCTKLIWTNRQFIRQDGDFENFYLDLDIPPPEEACSQILREVGVRAKEARRVEVPFDFVAPTPDQWWSQDSRKGINIPLGRVGATKRQHLKLGQGTSQHVLIAGKTGSGKSTLLHALICNLGLLYSPDEVEVYLVDFKKGVRGGDRKRKGIRPERVAAAGR